MKIYAFEVRDDERDYFNSVEKEQNITIELLEGVITVQRAEQLENDSAISVLGMSEIDEEILSILDKKNIRYISTRTIGYNHIDLEAAKRHNVHVCNAQYAPNGVAEYTIMMMLLCLRKYKQTLWRSQINDYSLVGLIGREIKDLTIGIVGTGSIGATVIKNLSGFGCKMLAYNRHENPEISDLVEYVSLDELYAQSDIITLHLPLNDSTYHMIDDDAISKMKKGVVIINCARGGLTDIKSLIRGIESEHIGALGLDCIENEESIVHKNLTDDIFSNKNMAYLRQFKNVVHTQHMAFYTDSAVQSMVYDGVLGLLAMAGNTHPKNQLC